MTGSGFAALVVTPVAQAASSQGSVKTAKNRLNSNEKCLKMTTNKHGQL
jgi:hypothetical protein